VPGTGLGGTQLVPGTGLGGSTAWQRMATKYHSCLSPRSQQVPGAAGAWHRVGAPGTGLGRLVCQHSGRSQQVPGTNGTVRLA
jgi:hypothetical protein